MKIYLKIVESVRNRHVSFVNKTYHRVAVEDVLLSGTYMTKVAKATIDSQDLISPVVRAVKTETDKNLANKSKLRRGQPY